MQDDDSSLELLDCDKWIVTVTLDDEGVFPATAKDVATMSAKNRKFIDFGATHLARLPYHLLDMLFRDDSSSDVEVVG